MKTLTSTPTKAKIDPKYWVINGAPDGATAQNDTTRLSCSAVRTADTNIYQIHVDNVAKFFSGVTGLSQDTYAAPYSYSPSGLWSSFLPIYAYNGDNFVFVNDTNGFSAGQELIVLEGDSATGVSPAFYSEWGQVGTAGQIPTINNNSVTYYSDATKVPTPANVAAGTDTSFYLTCSPATPTSLITGLIPDWSVDYVQSVNTTTNTITLWNAASAVSSWAVGQIVVNQDGVYLGTITSITTSGGYTVLGFGNTASTGMWSSVDPTSNLTGIEGQNNIYSASSTSGSNTLIGPWNGTGSNNVQMVAGSVITCQTSGVLPANTTITGSYATGTLFGTGGETDYLTLSNNALLTGSYTFQISKPIFGSKISTDMVGGTITAISWVGGSYTITANLAPGSNVVSIGQIVWRTSSSIYANSGYDSPEFVGPITSVSADFDGKAQTLSGLGSWALGSNAPLGGYPDAGAKFTVSVSGAPTSLWFGNRGAGSFPTSGDAFFAYTPSKAYTGIITTPGNNTYKVQLGPTPPFYCWQDPTPFGSNQAGSNADGNGGTGGSMWFYPYFKTLMISANISNWASTPVAKFVSISHSAQTVVTCDDTTIISQLLAANPSGLWLVFRGEASVNTTSKWKVLAVTGTNTFTVDSSSSTNYAVQQNAYSNGDNQNNIYLWEMTPSSVSASTYYWNIPMSSAISASTYNGTGSGVVTVNNGTIGGVHLSGTTVGSYSLGKRWIGTNTAGDLEALTIDQVGSRFTTSLYTDVQGGVSTSFVASPAPAQIAVELSVTFGQTGQNTNTLYTLKGSGSAAPTTGITKGMLVTGTGIPIGTVVTGFGTQIISGATYNTIIISNNPTVVSASNASGGNTLSFTTNVMNLTADITGNTSVAIVGSGATQEAVLLAGSYTSLDGSANNVPITWQLVAGTTFRFDHFAGEPIYTPNVLCYSNPLANDHGIDTPVVGSPDNSTTTNATSATALIAQNI